jgi:hypothetical protein
VSPWESFAAHAIPRGKLLEDAKDIVAVEADRIPFATIVIAHW